jgi:predicted nucleotidyltransferase
MRSDPSRLPIRFDADRLAAFCREKGIARLSLFGSVLRDDFDPATSDVDVLADFKPGATRGIGFRFFGYGDELGAILGRKVDFCSKLDPHVEPIVRREAVTIYEDPSEPTKLLETNDCHDLTAASSSLDFWDNPLDDEWDRQIAADAAAGRLDHLIEEARADVAAGRCRPLEDVLADESDETGR